MELYMCESHQIYVRESINTKND